MVEAEQSLGLELFSDPDCYKPKQELTTEYICGNNSNHYLQTYRPLS